VCVSPMGAMSGFVGDLANRLTPYMAFVPSVSAMLKFVVVVCTIALSMSTDLVHCRTWSAL
jgi:hypothetical protein